MKWQELTNLEQLNDIQTQSQHTCQIIFKHSTRCNISAMVLHRLNQGIEDIPYPCYYLDLIQYRNISNRIAEMFDVVHESPQLLIIQNGRCIAAQAHYDIRIDNIKNSITNNVSL